jgi:hypothetical protein
MSIIGLPFTAVDKQAREENGLTYRTPSGRLIEIPRDVLALVDDQVIHSERGEWEAPRVAAIAEISRNIGAQAVWGGPYARGVPLIHSVAELMASPITGVAQMETEYSVVVGRETFKPQFIQVVVTHNNGNLHFAVEEPENGVGGQATYDARVHEPPSAETFLGDVQEGITETSRRFFTQWVLNVRNLSSNTEGMLMGNLNVELADNAWEFDVEP